MLREILDWMRPHLRLGQVWQVWRGFRVPTSSCTHTRCSESRAASRAAAARPRAQGGLSDRCTAYGASGVSRGGRAASFGGGLAALSTDGPVAAVSRLVLMSTTHGFVVWGAYCRIRKKSLPEVLLGEDSSTGPRPPAHLITRQPIHPNVAIASASACSVGLAFGSHVLFVLRFRYG